MRPFTKLLEQAAQTVRDQMADTNRVFSAPVARSRTRGTFTGTGLTPLITSRSGR